MTNNSSSDSCVVLPPKLVDMKSRESTRGLMSTKSWTCVILVGATSCNDVGAHGDTRHTKVLCQTHFLYLQVEVGMAMYKHK